MFRHLGRALALLRDLRGKSQAEVARAAGLGKSQLSKYENGRELPKLDSLERLLRSLDVSHLELAGTVALIDNRARRLEGGEPELETWLLAERSSLSRASDEIFSRVVRDLLRLHQLVFAGSIFGPFAPPNSPD